MKIKEFFPILLLFIFSCVNPNKKDKDSSYYYDLEISTNNDLKILINENTAFSFSALFPYSDKSGKEYLTFSSSTNNSILFYDLDSYEFLFHKDNPISFFKFFASENKFYFLSTWKIILCRFI